MGVRESDWLVSAICCPGKGVTTSSRPDPPIHDAVHRLPDHIIYGVNACPHLGRACSTIMPVSNKTPVLGRGAPGCPSVSEVLEINTAPMFLAFDLASDGRI